MNATVSDRPPARVIDQTSDVAAKTRIVVSSETAWLECRTQSLEHGDEADTADHIGSDRGRRECAGPGEQRTRDQDAGEQGAVSGQAISLDVSVTAA